jgi:hypothetical protein
MSVSSSNSCATGRLSGELIRGIQIFMVFCGIRKYIIQILFGCKSIQHHLVHCIFDVYH